MFKQNKGFGLSGLRNFADQAIKATKAASEQFVVSMPNTTGSISKMESNINNQLFVSEGVSLPPGLEHLSQEERDKIMAVMACAEIDMIGASTSQPLKKTDSNSSMRNANEDLRRIDLMVHHDQLKTQTSNIEQLSKNDVGMTNILESKEQFSKVNETDWMLGNEETNNFTGQKVDISYDEVSV
jgi:hypothetical protein